MGSRYQNIMVTLGVFFAGVSAYIAWRGPRAADPPVVQSVATHPIGGLIVVGGLFLLAGVLNVAPLLIRLLPQRKPQSRERQLFVCSNGYPLMRIQSGIALNLQIVSSVATKLVYAHATLTRREGYQGQTHQIELESSEPHIIPAMQMFHRILERKNMSDEEAKRFMAPNVEIVGQLKLEENNTHQVLQFQLVTHQECPEDQQLRALEAKLHLAETTIATLKRPPDDLHVRLLCFERGTTLDMAETTYLFKLNISCDEETGIKDVKIKLTIGSEVVEAKPMDDLSGWILRTPFKNKDYPHKSFEEQVMTTVSLWDKLQRDGLRSGLVRDGWIGIKIEKLIPLTTLVSQLEMQITKSKQRAPFIFTFTTFPEREDVHIFDHAFREPS